MPQATDLVGLGLPPDLASQLGNQASTIVALGTTQAAAALMLTKNCIINAQSSQTGVIPNSGAMIGSPHFLQVGTISANSAVLYSPVGHNINGTLNGSCTIGVGKTAVLFQFAQKVWGTIPFAP